MQIPLNYIKRMQNFHQPTEKSTLTEFDGFSWNLDDAHNERIKESLIDWYENKYLWTPCDGWVVYKFKQIPKFDFSYSLYTCDALHLRHYFYSNKPIQENLKTHLCNEVPLCLYLKYSAELIEFDSSPIAKLNQLIYMQKERLEQINVNEYSLKNEWREFAKTMQSKFKNQLNHELSSFLMN
jgi:hypothetical protein